MEFEEIQKSIMNSFEVDEWLLPANISSEEKMNVFRRLLIEKLDELIHHDFEKLKWILYRIDINEKKLTEALQNTESDAATLMADMIIERQIQKAESRKKFSSGNPDWSFDV